MKKLDIVLENETGLHARPASMLVQVAKDFDCDIKIELNEQTYVAKSMMSILSMGATKGSELSFVIDGSDELKAYNELKELFDSNFGEN
ncbi:MAG TPA: HPr family phosphocarrier protein [Clostridia bacterium]|nr:HPr family phosphocarrier protein [Clostridia bacterium]